MSESFVDEQTEQFEVKAVLVAKYFPAYMRVIGSAQRQFGDEIVKEFEEKKLIPTLFFVDPWGYKGMTLRLINSVLKDWGCDCFFFFNYSRVNAGLANDAVEGHMNALFGPERANSLRARFDDATLRPVEREAFIVEEMCQALKDIGGKFVLPFRFHNRRSTRITHHLFFVTKHFKGYAITKDIMHAHATGRPDGPVNFEYNPADRRQPTLFELLRPLEDLEEMLLHNLAGRTMGIVEVYECHSVGKPYVLKNYQEVLCKLEQEGSISIIPPCPPRRKNTLAAHAKITFPKRN